MNEMYSSPVVRTCLEADVAELDDEVGEHRHAEDGGDDGLVAQRLEPVRRRQRQDRDGQEHADERQDHQGTECGADVRALGREDQHGVTSRAVSRSPRERSH